MAVRIRCLSCDTINRASEDDRGHQIYCRECDRILTVPKESDDDVRASAYAERKSRTRSAARERDRDDDDDDVDDRPRVKKKKKKSRSGSNAMYMIVGGVVALVLVFGCVGFGAVIWVARTTDRVGRAMDRQANLDRQRFMADAIRDLDLDAKGKIILDKGGRLAATDPADPTPLMVEVNARMKVHTVTMQAGKTYVISLISEDFDAYLRLEFGGKTLAEDDDSLGDLNARIVFRANQTGPHNVIATSFDGEVGEYHIRVQEQD